MGFSGLLRKTGKVQTFQGVTFLTCLLFQLENPGQVWLPDLLKWRDFFTITAVQILHKFFGKTSAQLASYSSFASDLMFVLGPKLNMVWGRVVRLEVLFK